MHTYDARLPRHESDGIAPPTTANPVPNPTGDLADGATVAVGTNEVSHLPESA